jgi:hypothetical protein
MHADAGMDKTWTSWKLSTCKYKGALPRCYYGSDNSSLPLSAGAQTPASQAPHWQTGKAELRADECWWCQQQVGGLVELQPAAESVILCLAAAVGSPAQGWKVRMAFVLVMMMLYLQKLQQGPALKLLLLLRLVLLHPPVLLLLPPLS